VEVAGAEEHVVEADGELAVGGARDEDHLGALQVRGGFLQLEVVQVDVGVGDHRAHLSAVDDGVGGEVLQGLLDVIWLQGELVPSRGKMQQYRIVRQVESCTFELFPQRSHADNVDLFGEVELLQVGDHRQGWGDQVVLLDVKTGRLQLFGVEVQSFGAVVGDESHLLAELLQGADSIVRPRNALQEQPQHT
jgi:hypothetical protein